MGGPAVPKVKRETPGLFNALNLASLQLGRPAVLPSPATHASLAQLKAGESVFQTLLLTKTVVHAYRGAKPLFHAMFWRQNTV